MTAAAPSEIQMDLVRLSVEYLGEFGKILGTDKYDYHRRYRENVLFFDSFLYSNKYIIWRGDIDYTLDRENLVKLSFEADEEIYLFQRDNILEDLTKVPSREKCSFYTNGTYDSDIYSFNSSDETSLKL